MITGKVDDYGRPVLAVTIRNLQTGGVINIDARVDTGFTSALMLLPDQITSLGLVSLTSTAVVFADGSQVFLRSHACEVDWLGSTRQIDALAGSGKFALIGLLFLEDCRLVVDYPARQVELTMVGAPPR